MEGKWKRRRLLRRRRQKRRASGASLILPNMGCTRLFFCILYILYFVFWSLGVYPFLPFFTLFFSLLYPLSLYGGSIDLEIVYICTSLDFLYLQYLHLLSSTSVTLGTPYRPRSCHLTKIKITYHSSLTITCRIS